MMEWNQIVGCHKTAGGVCVTESEGGEG